MHTSRRESLSKHESWQDRQWMVYGLTSLVANTKKALWHAGEKDEFYTWLDRAAACRMNVQWGRGLLKEAVSDKWICKLKYADLLDLYWNIFKNFIYL